MPPLNSIDLKVALRDRYGAPTHRGGSGMSQEEAELFALNPIPIHGRVDPEVVKTNPLPVLGEAKCRVFNLTHASDLKAYTAALDAVAKGRALIHSEHTDYVPEEKNYVVLLTWVEYSRQPIEAVIASRPDQMVK